MTLLHLSEVRADLAPYARSDGTGWSGWIRPFPFGARTTDTLPSLERVNLAPARVSCSLPRVSQGKPSVIAGWVQTSVSRVLDRTAVFTASVDLQEIEEDRLRSNPRLLMAPERAAKTLGEAWLVSKGTGVDPLEQAARAYERSAMFADELDLRAVLDVAAVPLLHLPDGRYSAFQVSPGTHGVSRGRLVVIESESSPDALEVFSVRLEGSQDSYTLVRATLGRDPSDPDAKRIVAGLVLGLEHVIAHRWLLDRAGRLNTTQFNHVKNTLLDPDTAFRQINEARYRLLELQSEYLEGVDRLWAYGLDVPVDSRELIEEADSVLRMREAWQHESSRFEQVRTLAESASGLTRNVHRQSEIPRNDRTERRRLMTNPFRQVFDWAGTAREPVDDEAVEYIEKHPEDNRFALFEEVSASLAMTTFMTATSVVFLGLVLTDALSAGRRGSLGFSGELPPLDVLFLFIASFGFLFSTLVYANASGRLARIGTLGFERQMELGNAVSEYLGVYPLLFAIPLSVTRYLGNGFVSVSVAFLAIVALAAYHYAPNTSLLERDISQDAVGNDRQRRWIWIPLLLAMTIVLYIGALTTTSSLLHIGGIALLALALLFCLFSLAAPDRPMPTHYVVDAWDALGEEAKSRDDPDWRRRLKDQRLGHRT